MDPVVVQSPTFFPATCAGCNGNQGPMVDYGVEIGPLAHHLYICKRCEKISARLLGFAPGPELEKLENVRATVDGLNGELEQWRRRNDEIEGLLTERDRQVEQQKLQIERIEGERDQALDVLGQVRTQVVGNLAAIEQQVANVGA